MDPRKKILILYASAGHGHEKAAKAIFEACQATPGVEARCEDVLRWASPMFGRNYAALYLFLIRHLPAVWGFFYHLADIRILYPLLGLLRRFANMIAARPLVKLIELENPWVVISTHFLPTEVVTHMKRTGQTHAHLVTVITDFLPHAFWLSPGTDLYAAALPETRTELLRRGVEDGCIQVTGIPIEKKFGRSRSRREIREKLGLDLNLFTVLLTGGGAGVGSVGRVAAKLLAMDRPVQALVVCGTNRALFLHLSSVAAEQPKLKVFGFVENMDELMRASDLLIGKAGGLTVTESLAVGTPMIAYEPVPGQESRNAVCLVRSGAGLLAHSLEDAVNIAHSFLENFKELTALKGRAHELGRPTAARDLLDRVIREF